MSALFELSLCVCVCVVCVFHRKPQDPAPTNLAGSWVTASTPRP